MNRIKFLRLDNGWSQSDLAKRLDCAPSSIAMYEKGERKPSLEVLIKLSEIFNCSIDYIIGNSDEKKELIDETFLSVAQNYKSLSKSNKEIVSDLIKKLKENQ